jgi:phenylalanyl-tRNA synthetase alpha chain
VLERCDIDPDRYQGFAFGMGIDRTAMLRYRFPQLRYLFEGDVRVLGQI